MGKPAAQDRHRKDREPLEGHPESPRDLIPGNIPLLVGVALLLLLGTLGLLLALAG